MTICTVTDCGRNARCKGLCQPHYMRWWRYGDPRYGEGRIHPGAEWSRTPAYAVWTNMRRRCENPSDVAYQDYGGRGIRVSERWREFGAFLEDMGQPPSGMSIERTDNNRGYDPGNCTWATAIEQGQNKRNNRLLTIDGETLTISAWGRRYGLGVGTIWRRLDAGWPAKAAVTCPSEWNRVGHPRGVPRWTLPFAPLQPIEDHAA